MQVRHQDLKRETPVIAQQGLDSVEVEHELREAAGSVRLGQMLISWQRQEGAAAHLRERGLSSLVWCLQRGEDPACGQDKQGGQQTGALVASGTAQPGVLIPRAGVSAMDEALCRSSAAPLVFNPFHSTHLRTGIVSEYKRARE